MWNRIRYWDEWKKIPFEAFHHRKWMGNKLYFWCLYKKKDRVRRKIRQISPKICRKFLSSLSIWSDISDNETCYASKALEANCYRKWIEKRIKIQMKWMTRLKVEEDLLKFISVLKLSWKKNLIKCGSRTTSWEVSDDLVHVFKLYWI